MVNSNLNLARKWRPINFDLIIGQDITVRILKNALYLNTFFPVYLFSGQRGCGKTSTARVFAAAINCQKLLNFQQNPKSFSIPCLECVSCNSMQLGQHPDFIEIDAASYTGVDNVRQIIEASSLLPLIGRKKIYLIDEAHMLSKSAFNAFLKILEEPPASVLFILATTDIQKIIDTVRSRSFQLFFSHVPQYDLLIHLKHVCKNESIEYDDEGLLLIIKESEGSIRDAINILEQVRFAHKAISATAVLSVLGHLNDDYLLNLIDILIRKKSTNDLLKFLDTINFSSYSAEYTFNKIIDLFRIILRTKQGINLNYNSTDKIRSLIIDYNLDEIFLVLDEFCKNEYLFLKTLNKHLFLEILFLRIITKNNKENNEYLKNKEIIIDKKEKKVEIEQDPKWRKFLENLKELNDPLVISVFSQANFVNFDLESKKVNLSLNRKFLFFQDLINDTTNLWNKVLHEIFGRDSVLNLVFEENVEIIKQKESIKPVHQEVKKEKLVDISDVNKWKIANNLISHFPGIISEVQEIDE